MTSECNAGFASQQLGSLLAAAKSGTFAGLVVTKKGTTRKGVVYGDARVHVTFVTGFKYPNLVQRSLDLLDTITDSTVMAAGGGVVTLDDVLAAREELRASFVKSVSGTNEAVTDHVYDPLVVDGEKVRGGRVYKCVAETEHECRCRDCTDNKRAPRDGVIYIQGIKVAQKVLVEPANGYWATKSRPKTVAKNVLRRGLPIDRYVSYALTPGDPWSLRVGGAALEAATQDGLDLSKVGETVQRCS